MKYIAPRWLPGGHLQTIWPALASRRVLAAPPAYRRERWTAPDGDFVDVDFLDPAAGAGQEADPGRPLLVLFHGLEGSSRSHYAEAFADVARERGWAYAVPHFRGCSGELNLAPRAYHSGDHEEIAWILARLAQRQADGALGADGTPGPRAPLLAVGVSLGGNALLRWAAEAGASASRSADAVAAVCSPLDLAAGGAAIGRGFNRQVYTRMFLRTMVPKALAKLRQHPGLFDRQALLAARDLYDFDNVFTAPLHGFRDTDDYWRRASAQPLLARIRIPALAVNARNDPFVPASSLPRAGQAGAHVTLWQPAHGGHVGFAQGRLPGHVRAMPAEVAGWLAAHGAPDYAAGQAPSIPSRHG
ncbi:YheT family hydrolase [Acidovorax sp. NCPPB 3576]|uniref:YheT family hydrolase n=1 Tax=Acidovorax sp. NCPPB 3576 TaxID=2940488 RepID=UPI00234A1BA1|nr:alpha/beta fold hydrolase [Acidovorax sp. NCPPB 3576]WCM87970.1 alpha/beta hydrolase [Acidovorax sp. NCPPB 3576]